MRRLALPSLALACVAFVAAEPSHSLGADGGRRHVDLLVESQGHVLGSAGKDQLGNDLAAGDVNADGISDLVAGAHWGSVGGRNIVGRSYAIFGRLEWPSQIDLQASGRDWSFIGAGREARMGSAVEVGDLDGDGTDDLVLGSLMGDPGDQTNGGVVNVVRGRHDAGGHVDFLEVEPDVLIAGRTADQIGTDMAIGDFNGDGQDDLAVAASLRESFTGAVFVWFGPLQAGHVYDLRDSSAHWTLLGPVQRSFFGANLGGGDLNGDGVDDLLVSAVTDASDGPLGRGAVYIFYGSTARGGTTDLSDMGTADVLMVGPADSDFGVALSTGTCSCRGDNLIVADVTGDGVIDLLVGAPKEQRQRGAVYIVPGPIAPGRHEVTRLPHVRLVPEPSAGRLGWWLRAGQLDGDAHVDLSVAAPWLDVPERPNAGRVYGVRGPLPISATLSVSNTSALWIDGPQHASGTAGISIQVADTNGDGVPDLHLGFPDDAPSGRRSVGSVFRLSGPLLPMLPTPSPTPSTTATSSPTPQPTDTPSPTESATSTWTPDPNATMATATATDDPTLTASSTSDAPPITASGTVPVESETPSATRTPDTQGTATSPGPGTSTSSTVTQTNSATPGARVYLPLCLRPISRGDTAARVATLPLQYLNRAPHQAWGAPHTESQ